MVDNLQRTYIKERSGINAVVDTILLVVLLFVPFHVLEPGAFHVMTMRTKKR